MADAMAESSSSCPQGMVSIAGLSKEKVRSLCEQAEASKEQTCRIANELFPKGYTCSGGKDAVEELARLSSEGGALQAKLQRSTTAYHSPYMEPARQKLEQALQEALPRLA